MWNQTRNLVGKTIAIGLLWGFFYCHRKPLVLPPWLNLQIQTSTSGKNFLFGTFMQKTRVYHFFEIWPYFMTTLAKMRMMTHAAVRQLTNGQTIESRMFRLISVKQLRLYCCLVDTNGSSWSLVDVATCRCGNFPYFSFLGAWFWNMDSNHSLTYVWFIIYNS